MDASLRSRAEQLASEMAGQATTIEDLNGLLRLMAKSSYKFRSQSEPKSPDKSRPRHC